VRGEMGIMGIFFLVLLFTAAVVVVAVDRCEGAEGGMPGRDTKVDASTVDEDVVEEDDFMGVEAPATGEDEVSALVTRVLPFFAVSTMSFSRRRISCACAFSCP